MSKTRPTQGGVTAGPDWKGLAACVGFAQPPQPRRPVAEDGVGGSQGMNLR
jgi:hypothetical protein